MATRYTKEWAKNISKSLIGKFKGEKNPFYGKTHTIETKERLHKAHLGLRYKQKKERSLEHRKHLSESLKGRKSWCKGLTKEDYRIKKIADKISGSNHYNWKGEKVTYKSLHQWINKRFGRIQKCEKCGTTLTKRFEWANKSGKYKRDRDDWMGLCTSCHHIYDDIGKKVWITRRLKRTQGEG